jgi:hypothetical protein
MTHPLKSPFALLASALALLGAPALRAQVLTFTVDINTAGLSADAANAPFDLDFQSIYGNSSDATSTVTLSNFVFTGGSATGSAVTSATGASGSLASSVTLTSSSSKTFSELYQQFTPGTTNIQFTATVTEPSPNIGSPTEFTAAVLDNSTGGPAELYTTAPDTESLLVLDLSASNTVANVQTYSAYASADGNTSLSNVSATVIPEPSTYAALLGGAAALYALMSRRSSRNRAA